MPPDPSLILAIETSNPTAHPGAAGVALGRNTLRGTEILGEEAMAIHARLDDDLMPAVDRVCRRCGVGPGDLGGVAVSIGPGGYTSVRIGVSAARLIARATGSRTFAIPSARVGAIGASRELPPGTAIAVCLAWKGEDVWRHRFTTGAPPTPLDEGALVRGADIGDAEVLVMEASFSEKLATMRSGAPAPRTIGLRLSAADVIRACAAMEPVDPVALSPVYPREPEAVTKWRLLGRSRRDITTDTRPA